MKDTFKRKGIVMEIFKDTEKEVKRWCNTYTDTFIYIEDEASLIDIMLKDDIYETIIDEEGS